MRCAKCGSDFPAGVNACPNCGTPVHYDGNTVFYGKVVSSKLTLKDIFSDVFKKHTKADGERLFVAGTPLTTPTPDRMLSEWQKPWLFMRVLAVGLIFTLLCVVLDIFSGGRGTQIMGTVGCVVIPIGILMFFWELNIPRDIPIYVVLGVFLIGGAICLIFTFIFLSILPDYDAPFAAFTEEPAKFLTTAIFIEVLGIKYGIGGLLIGAAVGTGFEAFENINYALDNFFKAGVDSMAASAITRTLDCFKGHIVWSALEGGALALVKGNRKLEAKHFTDKLFLTYGGIAIACHFFWNGGIWEYMLISGGVTQSTYDFVGFIVQWSITIFEWLVLADLIRRCIAQVLAVADTAVYSKPAAAAPGTVAIVGLNGPHKNCVFSLESGMVTIGRDPASCAIVLPENCAGISRRHCTVAFQNGSAYLMDHGSSYGTFLHNGQKLPPEQWVPLNGPFYLGGDQITFAVGQMDG